MKIEKKHQQILKEFEETAKAHGRDCALGIPDRKRPRYEVLSQQAALARIPYEQIDKVLSRGYYRGFIRVRLEKARKKSERGDK